MSDSDSLDKMIGGRRHRRQGHKTRKEPNVLKSWRKFVRKVQHEEHLSYPKAMKRASKRKSEWQRGGAPYGASTGGRRRRSRKQRGGEEGEERDEQEGGGEEGEDGGNPEDKTVGGRKRHSRRQRGGNSSASSVANFDGNYKQYGSVGGSRKRRRHRR